MDDSNIWPLHKWYSKLEGKNKLNKSHCILRNSVMLPWADNWEGIWHGLICIKFIDLLLVTVFLLFPLTMKYQWNILWWQTFGSKQAFLQAKSFLHIFLLSKSVYNQFIHVNHGFDFQKNKLLSFQANIHALHVFSKHFTVFLLFLGNLITFVSLTSSPTRLKTPPTKITENQNSIRLGESHTFDTYPCRSLCRKVPMSTLVYIMQWVHSLCVLSVADKKKTG